MEETHYLESLQIALRKQKLNDLLMREVYQRIANGDIELAIEMEKLNKELKSEFPQVETEKKYNKKLN